MWRALPSKAFIPISTMPFSCTPWAKMPLGKRFEKRNGDGATVQGITLEARANYDQKAQLEAGFTLQSSRFDEPVENAEGLESKREFLRTPNAYGYATLTFMPGSQFRATLNLVHTGSMQLVHFAGAPVQEEDAYVTTSPFTELSFKASYTLNWDRLNNGLELFGGIKNFTNAYQSDFDTGKKPGQQLRLWAGDAPHAVCGFEN